MAQLDGTTAELRVALRAIEKGFIPSRPLIEHCRYDLILDDGTSVYRVQVKQGNNRSKRAINSVMIALKSANRPDGSKKRPFYTRDEIDVILVYLPATNGFYWLPPDVWDRKSSISLSLVPANPNHKYHRNVAADYLW